MAAPSSTYDSNTDLSLGAIPQVEDEVLYSELLDLHNALESLLKGSDTANAIFTVYINKQRNNTAVTANYTVNINDGTIEVDATSGNIIITLPLAAGTPDSPTSGYRYDVKRVDLVTTNSVTIVGTDSELIDGRANGIKVSTKSSYTVKGNDDDDGYNII